ncbi:MAG: biotin--protein ligase [Thermomicrobiales bacterium]
MTARHGSFKTPGGKLVAVDFAVEEGRLRHVQVHGDFFLYPEDALTAITAALDGANADLSEEDLSQRIAAAIPKEVEWLGSSPQALATAVRRGLEADVTDDEAAGGGNRGFS